MNHDASATSRKTRLSSAVIGFTCSAMVYTIPLETTAAPGHVTFLSDDHAGMAKAFAVFAENGARLTVVSLEGLLHDAEPSLFSGDTEAVFQRLVSVWRCEVGPTSSASEMAKHPAYQRIIQMGEHAIPLILRELRNRPEHWFIALHSITGANPVPDEHRGQLEQMARDWISWGKDRGYLEN